MTPSLEDSLAGEQDGHPAEDDAVEQNTQSRDQPRSEGSSDGDEGEGPVRAKLQKTSIAGLKQLSGRRVGEQPDSALSEHATTESVEGDGSTNSTIRGRPAKKRSFDDLQNEGSGHVENGSVGPTTNKPKQHKRMRSRDVTSSEEYTAHDKLRNGPASTVEEESDVDAQHAPGGPGVIVEVPAQDGETATTAHVDEEMAIPTKEARDPVAAEEPRSNDTAVTEGSIGDQSTGPREPGVPAVDHEELGKTDSEEKPTAALPFGSHATTAASGFANTSSASPFGAFTGPKSPLKAGEKAEAHIKPASGSAFASSGLSAFAASEKSPFGVIGAKSPDAGGFGGATTGGGFGGASVGGGFGSTLGFGGTSPFATKVASGFGGLAGGFGAASGFGGGFASGSKPLGGLSAFGGGTSSVGAFGGADAKKQKAFGAPEDDENNDDEDEDGDDEQENDREDEGGSKAAKESHKLTEQQLASGEEDEETLFTCRAKLYSFEDRQWKERGTGMVKLNAQRLPEADTEDHDSETEAEKPAMASRKPRLLMRTDGVHRLVLNSPIFKEMEVGAQGKEPTGRSLAFQGFNEGKPVLFQIKIGKEDMAKELYYRIRELREDL